MKSDNVGCYCNSQSPEALFNFFKNMVQLSRDMNLMNQDEGKTSVAGKVPQQNHVFLIM